MWTVSITTTNGILVRDASDQTVGFYDKGLMALDTDCTMSSFRIRAFERDFLPLPEKHRRTDTTILRGQIDPTLLKEIENKSQTILAQKHQLQRKFSIQQSKAEELIQTIRDEKGLLESMSEPKTTSRYVALTPKSDLDWVHSLLKKLSIIS